MAGDDRDVVGEGKQGIVNGFQEFFRVASGEIGATYGACEECVSGEQEGLLGEVETNAAFGVTRGVEDGAA